MLANSQHAVYLDFGSQLSIAWSQRESRTWNLLYDIVGKIRHISEQGRPPSHVLENSHSCWWATCPKGNKLCRISVTFVFHKEYWNKCKPVIQENIIFKQIHPHVNYLQLRDSRSQGWDFQDLENYKFVLLLDQYNGILQRHSLLCLLTSIKIAISVLHSHDPAFWYRETFQESSLGRRSSFSTQYSGWLLLEMVLERCLRTIIHHHTAAG